ncbi:MAG: hypothetical protein QXF52_08655 [Thermoproteota archaeon]
MNTVKNHTKEFVVLTILLALAVSVVNAAVFVYYPISITAQWGPRPVYFAEGTNAGGTDLGAGNTITVSLSEEDTSASITVHPSRRGTTRYKDVLRIVNSDTQAYYIGFTVDTAFDDSAISVAQLIVRTTGGALVGTVDLTSTGTTWVPWTLDASSQLRVDLRFTISSGSSGSDSASITLVYSPQNSESPP